MNRERFNFNFKFLLLAYQIPAGLCDATTGLLLIFAPAWTLALMGVKHSSFPPAAGSFVGTFVLSVGLSYLYAAKLPMNAANAPRWQTVWILTALIRSLVAAFLFWQIARHQMETAWRTVALTDGALAAVQWVGLGNGWLKFDSAK
jgi:hypothetical protein